MHFNLHFPEGKPFDVVGMGLNSIDFLSLVPRFPESNSKMKLLRFGRSGGGQVATALVALSRWGIKTKYIGKVGSDDLGQLSLDSLRREGVDVTSVRVEPDTPNQFANILVEASSGERTILWSRDDRLMYRGGELEREAVCAGKLLHLDGHDIRAAIQCARWAREEGIPTVIDIDKVEPLTSELIREIDFIVTGQRFPSRFTGLSNLEEALLELKKQVPGFLCTTLGPEGAVALVEGRFIYVQGFKVPVVDTTGAGDVFHGGFIYGLLRNQKIDAILKFANAAAALKCRDLGGRTAIPTLDEIHHLINQADGPGLEIPLRS